MKDIQLELKHLENKKEKAEEVLDIIFNKFKKVNKYIK